jgi:hypothetical protein
MYKAQPGEQSLLQQMVCIACEKIKNGATILTVVRPILIAGCRKEHKAIKYY